MTHGGDFGDVEGHFADSVKQIRTKRGWSQEELAQALVRVGIVDATQVSVSRLEAKKRAIRLSEARALAAVFDLPLSALMSRDKLGEATEDAREALRNIRYARSDLAAATERLLAAGVAAEYYLEILERLVRSDDHSEVAAIARDLIVELDKATPVGREDFVAAFELAARQQEESWRYLAREAESGGEPLTAP